MGLTFRKTAAANPAGTGCLTLFGLPFAGFGVMAWVMAVRKLREGLLRDALMLGMFGLVFGGVGFGLIGFALFSGKAAKQVKARQALYPGSPWLWREDWASGQIRPSQHAVAVAGWVFTALWNAISWMVVIGLLTDATQSPPRGVWLLVSLFPTIGLFLLGASVRATLRARRFGGSVLRLKTLPAVPGGALDGTIELPSSLPKDAPVLTRLSCLRRVRRSNGDGSHLVETPIWQQEQALRPGLPEVRPGHAGIPIFFRIPPDQPTATPDGSGDGSILWRVEAEAQISGPDLKLAFEVPVFPGTPPETPAADPTAKYQLPIAAQRQAWHSRIQVSDARTGGKEFYFPALRNWGAAAFLGLFAIGWTAATVFLWRCHAPMIISVVFGLFDVVIVLSAVDQWCRSSRLVADSFSLKSTQRWLLLKREREFRATEIREIFTKVGMTAGAKSYHDLKLRLETGKEVTLASAIASQAEADWLRAELNQTLGRD